MIHDDMRKLRRIKYDSENCLRDTLCRGQPLFRRAGKSSHSSKCRWQSFLRSFFRLLPAAHVLWTGGRPPLSCRGCSTHRLRWRSASFCRVQGNDAYHSDSVRQTTMRMGGNGRWFLEPLKHSSSDSAHHLSSSHFIFQLSSTNVAHYLYLGRQLGWE